MPWQDSAAEDFFNPVPESDLFKALADTLKLWNSQPDWAGDERNVVLTLSRIWYSAATGKIAPKDVAAGWVMERLPVQHQPVLLEAQQAYLGQGMDLRPHADQLTAFICWKHEAASLLGSTPMMSNSSFKPTRFAARLNSGVGRQGKLNGNPNLRNTFLHFFLARSRMRKKACANVLTGGSFSANFKPKARVVADERQTDHVILVFDRCGQRNATRRPRHSRFHIHFLHFDAGAARDEVSSFPMGRHQKKLCSHNRQDPRLAIGNAEFYCLVELFAKEIGEDKARRYLKQIDYTATHRSFDK